MGLLDFGIGMPRRVGSAQAESSAIGVPFMALPPSRLFDGYERVGRYVRPMVSLLSLWLNHSGRFESDLGPHLR